MDEADYWRIEVFRGRLRHSLAARFLLRFHVSLMLSGSIAAGFLGDIVMLHAGLREMRIRYPLAIGMAYLGFLGGVRLWLAYSGIGQYLNLRRAGELVEGGPSGPGPRMFNPDWLDGISYFPDFDGCLYVLLAVIAFFALGGYALVAAPSLFADVVLEVMLAAGLLRGIRRVEASGWAVGVWRSTWGSFAFSVAVAIVFAMWAHETAPAAATASEALGQARHHRQDGK